MAIQLALQLILLALLLIISGFCSSSETVFFSLNPIDVRRLAERYPFTARRVRMLTAQPTRLLATILICNTIVNIAASFLAYRIAHRVWPAQAEFLAIFGMTALLLVFGEYGPKRAALMFTDPLARLYAPVLCVLVPTTEPFHRLLAAITHRLEPLFRARGRTLSGEELRTVFDLGNDEGLLDAEELAMVKAIIDLERMKAADVMTPRVDLRGLDLDALPSDVTAYVLDAPFKFLLLYRGDMDHVEGFLDVRKYLLDSKSRLDVARLPPYYVPETAPLNRLLAEFQQHHVRVAVVVDEYGGTAGLITRGDILEEITGDIYDELGRPRPVFQEAGPHRWLVDPTFSLDDLNRRLRLDLEAEGADRLAGWITHHLGRVPGKGDVVEAQGVRVTVLKAEKARIMLAQIEKVTGKDGVA